MTEPGAASGPPPRVEDAAAAGALPIAPGLAGAMEAARLPRRTTLVDRRVLLVSAVAIPLAVAAALVAQLLTALIGLVTNLAFYGRLSTDFVSPAGNRLGPWVILVPVLGGLVVGAMARWGSRAIRGHGIPEAMEQVLLNESRIAPRITFLKPLSSAVAIGSGGPFGAEGPVIATGGALGSLVGQLLRVTAAERKTLLAAGAAAGMAAVFGSPLSAVVLAVELLLFELRPRSLVPVALATVAATGVRHALAGSAPVFPMPLVAEPGMAALACYVLLGALVGLASVGATRIVYGIEDLFEKLPLHWMWWPALGGLVVGLVGWIEPRTLGVGYDTIEAIVAGHFGAGMLLSLALLKFASWSVALGSGTSGGTLAPLFTIGGALGALAGIGLVAVAPHLGIDPRMAGLVGMAAIFAGASRALLASIVFAFETTRQPAALLPLLGGCVAAYLVSALVMRNTIMTEKIARRGVRVPSEYGADYLEQIGAGTACTREVVTLREDDRLGDIRHWLASGKPEAQHQGYPVLGEDGRVLGVLTRRDLLDMRLPEMHRVGSLLRRPPIVVGEQHSLREAADHMVAENVGRLVVVAADAPGRMVGILTRGDLLAAHARRLREKNDAGRHLRLRGPRRPRGR